MISWSKALFRVVHGSMLPTKPAKFSRCSGRIVWLTQCQSNTIKIWWMFRASLRCYPHLSDNSHPELFPHHAINHIRNMARQTPSDPFLSLNSREVLIRNSIDDFECNNSSCMLKRQVPVKNSKTAIRIIWFRLPLALGRSTTVIRCKTAEG